MIDHLQEQKVSYFSHWCKAIKISAALLIHAFLPNILSDYASRHICDGNDVRAYEYSKDENGNYII